MFAFSQCEWVLTLIPPSESGTSARFSISSRRCCLRFNAAGSLTPRPSASCWRLVAASACCRRLVSWNRRLRELVIFWGGGGCRIFSLFYGPQAKLGQGNVLTGVCLSTGGWRGVVWWKGVCGERGVSGEGGVVDTHPRTRRQASPRGETATEGGSTHCFVTGHFVFSSAGGQGSELTNDNFCHYTVLLMKSQL